VILVSVGTQLAFPRMLHAIQTWHQRNPTVEVVAQVGVDATHYSGMRCVSSLHPGEYQGLLAEAEVLVAHAGVGSLLSAMRAGKPIIIMPRRAELGEHRSDHQLATAARVRCLDGVYVAKDGEGLAYMLDERGRLRSARELHNHARLRMLRESLRKMLHRH